jgi:molecular chaperone DnaK
MTPEQASTEILKALIAQANMAAGDFTIDGAIVTIPAAFNQMQSEATMRAAAGAGLEKVGLLQEPIAAALASISDRQRTNSALKDGQFLVYDLGGGTFDVAIVQSIGGSINITGHAGVNMLGGTDFDRTLVNTIVRPWLLEKFDLPADFQKDPAYARVLRIAAFCVEKAKIEVSAQPTSTIFADESQLGARDRSQQEMYLDIPLDRSQVEMLVADQIDRSIDVCRKLISDAGYDYSDIDRIVFIGGPTRMPIVRERVPHQLGIMADLNSDPMTSVAMGAAIFAESREWKSEGAAPKKTRSVARTEGPINIEYGFPERTPDARIRIRVRPGSNVVGKGYRLQLDSDMGWTSGQLALDGIGSINDVPVARRGDNQFRALVFDEHGTPVQSGETRFTVKRVDAASSGAPLTHTISVKVVEGPMGSERNTLDDLIEKGHSLPASGTKEFKAARDLKPTDDAHLDFEVYQREPGVSDPKLSLHVGAFRISSKDLDRGEIIRRGDKVTVLWTLDENGLLNCELEVKGEAIGRRFKAGKMFTDQGAQKNFEGQEGETLAKVSLEAAQTELDELEKTIGPKIADEAAELKQRLERKKDDLNTAYEADTRRSIAEEGRAIRQEISRIKNRRENVGDVLKAELDSLVSSFDVAIRPNANHAAAEQFDALARQARESIGKGNIEDAQKSITEMRSIGLLEASKQPSLWSASSLTLPRSDIWRSIRWLMIDSSTKGESVWPITIWMAFEA